MPQIKAGPLTVEEIQALWESAADPSYTRPFVQAGEGNGFEAWTQLFRQYARVSQAIDVTTQSMFILPWSGQTSAPAGGNAFSRVSLKFSRTKQFEHLLVLGAGTVFVDEQQTDSGVDGPIEVLTGRRYVLEEDLVLQPGERGPKEVAAVAELPGFGYDNPLPGTLRVVPQPGKQFENDLATVTNASRSASDGGPRSQAAIVADAQADMFVPDHVGQYVRFVAGANAGKVARISGFGSPVPAVVGSTAGLDLLFSFRLSPSTGTFVRGEKVTFSPAAYGEVVGDFDPASGLIAIRLLNGTVPAVGTTAAGATSAATGTVDQVMESATFSAEAPSGGIGGASWHVLDWVVDWGLEVTNDASPAGGRSAFLDELGGERGVNRSPGEDDDSYRPRVSQVADVVTPNAVRRALNRALAGLPWCFREVGRAELPGWFYDGDLSPPGGTSNASPVSAGDEASYDEDVILLDGVPGVGMSFDAGFDAYDSGTFPMFFDGSGSFVGIPGSHERVVLETPDFRLYAEGWFGRLDTTAAPGVWRFVFVRTGIDEAPATIPTEGLRVRGLHTGALFAVQAISVPATVNQRRFRRWLDYEQFRAFFLVGVGRLGIGEFGYAYDGGPHDAYDSAPYEAFFDGFPRLAADVYRRVYNAVDAARAGGVGFQLYLEDIGCP